MDKRLREAHKEAIKLLITEKKILRETVLILHPEKTLIDWGVSQSEPKIMDKEASQGLAWKNILREMLLIIHPEKTGIDVVASKASHLTT